MGGIGMAIPLRLRVPICLSRPIGQIVQAFLLLVGLNGIVPSPDEKAKLIAGGPKLSANFSAAIQDFIFLSSKQLLLFTM